MIEITYFAGGLCEPRGQRVRTTWERLLSKLTRPRVAASKDGVPGISLATFSRDYRNLENVERVYAVGLDLDKSLDWSSLIEQLADTDAFMHTTWSSTMEEPRARAFLRLSRPVTGAEYRRVYAAVCGVVESGGFLVDRKASDPSRFWFLPSMPPDGAYAFSVGRGRPVNVDAALAKVPPPAPPPPPVAPAGPVGDVEARAAAYLERCEPAISGSGGHNATFLVAQKIVRGFALDEETAYRLLSVWNLTCDPPWSERELRRKIRQAATRGTLPEGSLLERRRAS